MLTNFYLIDRYVNYLEQLIKNSKKTILMVQQLFKNYFLFLLMNFFKITKKHFFYLNTWQKFQIQKSNYFLIFSIYLKLQNIQFLQLDNISIYLQLSQINNTPNLMQVKENMSIFSTSSDRKLWTREEDLLIIELVNNHGVGSWIPIALQMKTKFFKHARTSKQIRERYKMYNSKDGIIIYPPKSINRNGLTNNKVSFFRFTTKLEVSGNKLQNTQTTGIKENYVFRTDNAVKNHFYSTLRRSLRRINKFYGFKNSTNQMKNLKPSTLTFLIEKSNESTQSKNLIKKIFDYAKQKPKKNSFQQSNFQQYQNFQQQKQKFQQLLTQLDNFNLQFSFKKSFKMSTSFKNIPELNKQQQLQKNFKTDSKTNQLDTFSQKKQRKKKRARLQKNIQLQQILQEEHQKKMQISEILAEKQMNTIDSTYLQNQEENAFMTEQKEQDEFYFGNEQKPATHWFDNEQHMNYHLPIHLNDHNVHGGNILMNYGNYSNLNLQNNPNYVQLQLEGDFNQI